MFDYRDRNSVEQCMLPPPMQLPNHHRSQRNRFSLPVVTAGLLAREAKDAFDAGDRAWLEAALHALVDLVARSEGVSDAQR